VCQEAAGSANPLNPTYSLELLQSYIEKGLYKACIMHWNGFQVSIFETSSPLRKEAFRVN
jgi:hypothetical protein